MMNPSNMLTILLERNARFSAVHVYPETGLLGRELTSVHLKT